MCILAVATNFSDEFSFLLMHNRDEFYSRTSSPPEIVHYPNSPEGHVLLIPQDHQSGGTWMGFNISTQKVVALTNVRALSPSHDDRRSRGELVLKALTCGDENVQEEHYYNYHLLQVNLNLASSCENKMTLTTSAPPTYKPCEVEYKSDEKPFVATKSNDHGIGFTTAEADDNNIIRWPKAVWLRDQVERILTTSPLDKTGQAGAEELLARLEPVMSATSMGSEYNAKAAAVVPSLWNPLSRKQELLLSKAPFVEPFLLFDNDDDSLYGTVSQSVLLYSKKETCLYYAYRETRFSRHAKWTWHRVELDKENVNDDVVSSKNDFAAAVGELNRVVRRECAS